MAGQADGSIIIDTELSSDGFKAGSAELLAAIKSLSDEMKDLKSTVTELFNKPLTPKIDTSGTTQKASDLQREISAVNTSVERLEPTFQKAMSGSESAMATFEGKASVLESKIAELQQSLDRVGQTAYPTQEYEALCAEAEKVKQKFDALLDRQEKMQATGVNENSAQWKSLQYDMDLVSNKYHELIAQKQQLEASGGAFQMGVDTSAYAQMEATLSAASARLAEMRAGTGESESLMRRLASSAGRVASFIGKAAASAAGALVSGIKSAASHMAGMLTHSRSMKGQFNGLISSAKKFTLSLLGARGVYALLRKAVSAYMAQNQQLANTLSSCWSGIGNLLGPIITRLINLVAQAVAYITSFLKLFGIFSKGAQKAIGGAGSAAAGAAKDLKRQLASFDELNVLSDNGSSGGGGGGGGAGGIGTELPDVTLPDWAKLMVEQLKAGDWVAAATTLAEQLNKMLDSVDWAGIGKKIGYYLNGVLTFIATFIKKFDWKGVGSKLATLLNNIITSVDWGNLGVILTGKLAILLQFLTGFFETFDGKAFGDGIYDFIMGGINAVDWVKCTGDLSKAISKFITSIDFGKIGQALSTGFRTILQSIDAAITNFDWDGVGGKVADFINGIDWGGLFSDCVSLIGDAFVGAFNLLSGFIKKIDWAKLADEVWEGLESLVNDIDWDNFGESLGQFLSDAITGVFTFIGTLFSDHDWGKMIQDLSSNLGTAFCSMIENIDWGSVLSSLATALVSLIVQIPGMIVGLLGGKFDILASIFEAIGLDGVAGFFKGMSDALSDVGAWLKENLVDPVVNWVKDLFGIHSPSTVFAEIGNWLIEGLLQGISAAWQTIVDFFAGVLDGLTGVISDAWEGIKSLTSDTWTSIKSSLSSTWSSIKSTASSTWSNMKSAASDAWANMKSTASSTWSSIKSSLSGTWDSIKSTASSTWSSIKSTIQNQGWSGVGSNICNGISSGIDDGWSWLKNKVSNVANNLLSAAKSALGIHSPSKLFRDEVGLNIGYGVGEGVEDSQPSILRSVSGVADAIAEEMNAGDYSIKAIAPTKQVDGTMTDFADRITDGFTSMLDRLQAIAKSVTFTAPAVSRGIIPYKAAAMAGSASTDVGSAIEASNDELASVVTQVVMNASSAIVAAIQTYSGATVNFDKAAVAEMTIKEINRRTRMTGSSPLLV